MAQPLTLGQLVNAHFKGSLCVDQVADMPIKVTNTPDYENETFTVVAASVGTKGYALFHSDSAALVLTDINMRLKFDASKGSSGWIRADLDFGGIQFNVQIVLSSAQEEFEFDSQLTKPVSLASVVKKLLGSKTDFPPGLPKSTKVIQASMTLENDHPGKPTLQVTGELDGKLTVPLAGAKQAFDVSFCMQTAWAKKKLQLTNASLDGNLALASKSVLELTYTFGPKVNKFEVEAQSGSSFSFASLAKLFGVKFDPASSRTLAGNVPELEIQALEFTADFKQKKYALSGTNARGDEVFVFVEKFSDTWGLAVAVETPKRWKLADLTPKLKSADFVSFDHAFLALSTHSLAVPKGVFDNLGENVFNLVAGLNFGAVVAFDAAAAKASPLNRALHSIFGDLDLFLEATIGARIQNFSIDASLGSAIDIPLPTSPKSKLVITSPMLRFSPAAEKFSVEGSVEFPIKNGKTTERIAILGRFDIDEERVDFAVIGSQENSLSLQKAHGTELEEIGAEVGFTIGEPGVTASFAGKMLIGAEESNDEFAMSVLLPEFDPLLVYASFERIDLRSMFQSLCSNGELPSYLNKGIVFEDFTIWMCSAPPDTGCTLADKAATHVNTGFGFSGKADLFGYLTAASLDIEPTSIKGRLQVEKPLRIPGILAMSDTSGKRGPYFDLDTTKSALDINCAFDVLGFKFSEGFSFGPRGFAFHTHFSFRGNRIKLNCTVGTTARGAPLLSIVGGSSFRKLEIWGVTVKSLRVSFDTRPRNPAFKATAHVKVLGVPDTETVSVSVGQIEHDIANLGREIEKAFKSVF